MEVVRIEGIKYNLDRQTDEELANIRDNLVVAHARITGEIALLETVLFERHNPQLTFDTATGPDFDTINRTAEG